MVIVAWKKGKNYKVMNFNRYMRKGKIMLNMVMINHFPRSPRQITRALDPRVGNNFGIVINSA